MTNGYLMALCFSLGADPSQGGLWNKNVAGSWLFLVGTGLCLPGPRSRPWMIHDDTCSSSTKVTRLMLEVAALAVNFPAKSVAAQQQRRLATIFWINTRLQLQLGRHLCLVLSRSILKIKHSLSVPDSRLRNTFEYSIFHQSSGLERGGGQLKVSTNFVKHNI